MNLLSQLETLAIAVVLSLAVGFGGGWYVKGKFVTAEQVTVVKEARVGDGIEIDKSLKKSVELSAAIDKSNKNNVTIRKEITRYAPKPVPVQPVSPKDPDSAPVEIQPADTRDRITVGELRLLNAARLGTPVESAGVSDGKEQAPSAVGRAELIDNDLQVVGLYHELAKKHDELVDWVAVKMKEQRERLSK